MILRQILLRSVVTLSGLIVFSLATWKKYQVLVCCNSSTPYSPFDIVFFRFNSLALVLLETWVEIKKRAKAHTLLSRSFNYLCKQTSVYTLVPFNLNEVFVHVVFSSLSTSMRSIFIAWSIPITRIASTFSISKRALPLPDDQ